jgi:hypothetical protein
MGKDGWVQWRPVEEVAQTAVDVMLRGLVHDGRGRSKANGV